MYSALGYTRIPCTDSGGPFNIRAAKNIQSHKVKDRMADSHTAFIGSIPEYYDQYLGPILFEEYALDLARRISVPAGGTVLEIAAGTGIATRHIRNILSQDVQFSVTDLNESMLEYSMQKFNGRNNMGFQAADAAKLSFPATSFDSVLCQFSLMFFPDKLSVLDEVVRVLKPGGVFVFNIWDSYEHNHLAQSVNETLIRLFPENPPPFFDVPYGYFQIDEVKGLLGQAGFGEIEIAVLPRDSLFQSSRQVAFGFILGTPVCIQIDERGGIAIEEVVDIVDDNIYQTYERPLVKAKMQAIVFKAYRSN
jgi:SAM-dependent methyltransferase